MKCVAVVLVLAALVAVSLVGGLSLARCPAVAPGPGNCVSATGCNALRETLYPRGSPAPLR